jgi:hypothetical protein
MYLIIVSTNVKHNKSSCSNSSIQNILMIQNHLPLSPIPPLVTNKNAELPPFVKLANPCLNSLSCINVTTELKR